MRRSAGVCHSAVLLPLQHACLLLVRRRFVKRFILLMLLTQRATVQALRKRPASKVSWGILERY